MPRKLTRKPTEQKAEKPKPDPLLYGSEDACLILGRISKQMLYRLVNDKQLHPVKIGTRTLFTKDDLLRFVQEREDAAQAG